MARDKDDIRNEAAFEGKQFDDWLTDGGSSHFTNSDGHSAGSSERSAATTQGDNELAM